MRTDLLPVYEAIDERKQRVNPLLIEAYHCKPGCFAVVENVSYNCGLTPKEVIADPKRAVDQFRIPLVRKQLEVDSDYVPAMDHSHGTVLMASVFGAAVEYPPGEWPWARPRMQSIHEVDHLKLPRLRQSPPMVKFFEELKWMQEYTDARVPILAMDLQSPFTTATQVFDANQLLVELLDHPDKVRLLVDMITEANLEFMEILNETLVAGAWPGRNYPSVTEPIGICVADDTPLIFLSPAMYAEFALPSLQRLAAAMPGLFIHSCGDYLHQVGNLLTIPNLRALQMHTGPHEIDSYPAWQKLRGRCALWSDTCDVSLGDTYRGRFHDCYEEYVLPRLLGDGDVTGLVLLTPPAATVAERERNHQELRARLRQVSSRKGKAEPAVVVQVTTPDRSPAESSRR